MRYSSLFTLAAFLTIAPFGVAGGTNFAFSQENPAAPAVPPAVEGKTGSPGAAPKKSENEKKEQSFEELFTQLRMETNKVAGRRVAQQIWDKWNDSGSATVNLLMGWAGEAMAQDKNALAEDLLSQVIALAPEYAEGWNRRATLYFGMGRIGASLGDIERTLLLEPRHFGALSGLAAILQGSSQEKKALVAWKKILEIYPAHPQAQQAVVELEEKLAGQDT